MYIKTLTNVSTMNFSEQIEKLAELIHQARVVMIGAGAGLSAAAGFEYSGARFQKFFSDFAQKYPIQDMYSGGFYSFPTAEEYWAYWSRYIFINRYMPAPKPVYNDLFELMKQKDYFVLTTNVDHQFQHAGFDKERLFYTQGDYGLFQCSVPCHEKTYDNEEIIRQMRDQQQNMSIPSQLLPICPVCGKPMCMNLRADSSFVQDDGWYAAAERYEQFTSAYKDKPILYLELGVGDNTPGIIKFPFWQMTAENSQAALVCMNNGEATVPEEIKEKSLCINTDIGLVLEALKAS